MRIFLNEEDFKKAAIQLKTVRYKKKVDKENANKFIAQNKVLENKRKRYEEEYEDAMQDIEKHTKVLEEDKKEFEYERGRRERDFEVDKKKIELDLGRANKQEVADQVAEIAQLQATLNAAELMIKFLKEQQEKGMPMTSADVKGLAVAVNSRIDTAKEMKKLAEPIKK